MFPLAAAVIAVAVTCVGFAWRAQADVRRPASFTKAQADQGQDVFASNCASCHGPNLNDGQFGPSLKGRGFRAKWASKSVGDIYSFAVANMPPGQAGVLPPDDYAAVMAFILSSNGVKPADKPLPADADALAAMAMPG